MVKLPTLQLSPIQVCSILWPPRITIRSGETASSLTSLCRSRLSSFRRSWSDEQVISTIGFPSGASSLIFISWDVYLDSSLQIWRVFLQLVLSSYGTSLIGNCTSDLYRFWFGS